LHPVTAPIASAATQLIMILFIFIVFRS